MQWTGGIVPADDAGVRAAVREKLDSLTKPPGSLGRLEEFVMRYCLCHGTAGAGIQSMKMFTFAADHGITASGVAPYPPEVTAQMVRTMCGGGAAVSALCRGAGIKYAVVDMGVAADLGDRFFLIDRKVARGTENFHAGAAMSPRQCEQAVDAGYGLALEGFADMVGVGEMGIGNSSSAAALYCLLLDADPDRTVGPGSGARGDLLARKRRIIREAVDFHRMGWDGSPFDALCRVGGFEIAGIAGMILGQAKKRVPVAVDGYIATAAAMTAMKMDPNVGEYLFFSHVSAEPFHRELFAKLDRKPILDLEMRLGEGTGAVLAMQIIRQAMNCYHQMATFDSAGISGRGDS